MAGLAVSVFPTGAVAGTLDQSQSSTPEVDGVASDHLTAQTFTAGLTGNLDQVDVALGKFSTFCNLDSGITVEIRTVAGSIPTATTLASGNLSAQSIPLVPPSPPIFVSLTFAAPAAVTAGTQYALVISAPDTSCMSIAEVPYCWGASSGNPYGGGVLFGAVPDGVLSDADAAFKTYVVPSSPSPPPSSPSTATPSNAISLGKAVLNKAKGTATVPVFVPGPGVVTLTGKGVVKQRREKAYAGIVNLLVKPSGNTLRKLSSTGKAKVRVTITYTTTGGSSSSKTKSFGLKKRLS